MISTNIINSFKDTNYGMLTSKINFNYQYHHCMDLDLVHEWRIYVISVVFIMERKSSFWRPSDFCNSKITEAILEEITVRGMFITKFHFESHNLCWGTRLQVRKGHYLTTTRPGNMTGRWVPTLLVAVKATANPE